MLGVRLTRGARRQRGRVHVTRDGAVCGERLERARVHGCDDGVDGWVVVVVADRVSWRSRRCGEAGGGMVGGEAGGWVGVEGNGDCDEEVRL